MQQMVYEIRVNLDHYVRLQEEAQQATAQTTNAVEEMADVRMELYTILDRYALVYQMDLYHEGNETDLLERLKNDKELYEEYMHCREQLDLIHSTMEEQKRLLHKYLDRFPLEAEGSAQEQLHLVRSKRIRYGQLQDEIQQLQEKIKLFEEDNQVKESALSVEELQEKQVQIDEEIKRVHQVHIGANEKVQSLLTSLGSIPLNCGVTLADLIRRPELNYECLAPIDPDRPELHPEVREQVNIHIKYEGYITRQQKQVENFKKIESKKIPNDIDYEVVPSLRIEARQKLEALRPLSIGQASRISGVSPADISVLLVYLESYDYKKEHEQ